jgi:exodeoxyribonuclease V beta subunit
MSFKDFDANTSPLHTGISLIEASAGTGKTYTIAMLVLRLVVERAIPIEQILVVTFTKAATEELKDRIRARLADARRELTAADATANNPLSTWLAQLAISQEDIKRRLEMALLNIDQAGIFTIHGFCQRVLGEHALASGQLFDAELTDDLASIQQSCTDDFWRQHVQQRDIWEIALLTRDFKTPDALLQSISLVDKHAVIYPEADDMERVLANFKALNVSLHDKLPGVIKIISPHLGSTKFKTDFNNNFSAYCAELTEWLKGGNLQLPSRAAITLLTTNGIFEALNGTQFKTTKQQSSDERKAEFIAELNLDLTPFDELEATLQHINVCLRRNLLTTLQTELDKRLEQMNVWSFDNLITHLARALNGSLGEQLCHELRQRFAAALIDEFQDTDNNQWQIFSTLFGTPTHYLVLVGDPKQAIYKFRGADIFSYLAAQQYAQHQFTLRQNWRSQPLLVEGVNRLFAKDKAFLLDDIHFTPSASARTAEEGCLIADNKPLSPVVLWQVPPSDTKAGYWQPNAAATIIRTACINEIINLLTGNFCLQPGGNKIQPQDIAILVRTNNQAKAYQDELRAVQVPSVLTSTESVFNSAEAMQLYTLLTAVAHPGDLTLLREALALSWFGYDGYGLHQLLNDERALDVIATRFVKYNQLWQRYSVMAMIQDLLSQEKITTNIAETRCSERLLTNLQHVLELLQHAVIDEHLGIHKTLCWLKSAITQAQINKSSAENQQLRLESDADAVKIVTMHRAKGLEYAIVFCPYLWQDKQGSRSNAAFVKCHLPVLAGDATKRLIVDLGSNHFKYHAAQEREEQRAEDIRLAYVAVTRAKYRCYIPWANVRSEKDSNQSALSYLLDLGEQDFAGQQNTLLSLASAQPDVFCYSLLAKDDALSDCYNPNPITLRLTPQSRRRYLTSDWQMSSYTALSSLSLSDTPEIPADKADESLGLLAQDTLDALPSGAHTGNVIHELLEIIPFQTLAQHADIAEQRDAACQRFGLWLAQPKLIDDLLQKVVATPLLIDDPDFCLMNLSSARCLKEMPFYLNLPASNTADINTILQDEATFQRLSHKQMRGLLTGFIDLICEYKGRYYVMDYKTNTLPNYHTANVIAAMRGHNYGLQYWLYCVVLHLYLQNRLPDYDYGSHFGGVRYLFVRGMMPKQPMSGVFEAKPDVTKLTALSALFKE